MIARAVLVPNWRFDVPHIKNFEIVRIDDVDDIANRRDKVTLPKETFNRSLLPHIYDRQREESNPGSCSPTVVGTHTRPTMSNKAFRLPPLPKFRIKHPTKEAPHPCTTVMSSVLACWASSGYGVQGCEKLEEALRTCMDTMVRSYPNCTRQSR